MLKSNWPGECKEVDEKAIQRERKKQITVMTVSDDIDP